MKIKNNPINIILLAGSILGLLSVLLAAYIDHSLPLVLTAEARHSLSVALKYHQLYAIVITIIGLILPLQTNPSMRLWLIRSTYIFMLGILLFSFSIYLALIAGMQDLVYFAPFGGVILMLGWGCLIRVALLRGR